MISWKVVQSRLTQEDWEAVKAEIGDAWHESGLLVAYEWEFPFQLLEGEIAGVPWRDVYMRGRWGGAGGVTEFQQLLDYFVVNVWPYVKLAGEITVGGLLAKAGADAWDVCKSGLKRGLRRVLARSKVVEVDVVHDSEPAHDLIYEITHEDLDTVEDAVDAIAKHAQGIRSGSVTRLEAGEYMRWNGQAQRLEPWRRDAETGSREPVSSPEPPRTSS